MVFVFEKLHVFIVTLKHCFRVNTKSTMWDKIGNSQTKFINFTNSLIHSFQKIIQKPEDNFNFAFVIECSNLLKSYLNELGKCVSFV